MDLVNSKRVLPSTNLVTIELNEIEKRQLNAAPGRAVEKLNFLRALSLGREDLATIETELKREKNKKALQWMPVLGTICDLLHAEREQSKWEPALYELSGQIPYDILNGIIIIIQKIPSFSYLFPYSLAFQERMHASPVGRLHLERLEMYPIGMEQGELVFTVPMAPCETVTLSHKEWTRSKDEYESIVQDYFESYSERGVTEKSDAAMSSETETRHANSFNFTASASGGYGPVTLSTALGLQSSAEDRNSAKQSAQRSREITQKASARTRQEHKVSVKLETSHGTEDASYKTITNPHDDKAIRVDYFRMMRKWRTDHFRYGLRLTFDVMVPNPAARLWAQYRELGRLDAELAKPFAFALTQNAITDTNWPALSTQYGVAVDPPLPAKTDVTIARNVPEKQTGDPIYELVAPPGYEFLAASGSPGHTHATATVHAWYNPYDEGGIRWSPPPASTTDIVPYVEAGPYFILTEGYELLAQGTGEKATLSLMQGGTFKLQVLLTAEANRRKDAYDAWRLNVWTKLRDAEFARFQERRAALQQKRDDLWFSLAGKDTLTLRRMEREELIRGVLLWLLGPTAFEQAPDEVAAVIRRLLHFETNDAPDTFPTGGAKFRHITSKEWGTAAAYGDFVRFVHQAIEWENLLYFLYPYFWGSDDLGREKLLFDHPDPLHRDFLRCGYARVVIPVRPGYETDVTELLETGLFAGTNTSPYMTIAEEISKFALTNYAGIPPANPELHSRPALYPQQRATWSVMEQAVAYLEDYLTKNGKYPADLSGSPDAPYKDAWGNDLVYKIPGSGNDYDLFSYGADGAPGGDGVNADISAAAGATLIASWFDYTPTSGLDIELVGKPISV